MKKVESYVGLSQCVKLRNLLKAYCRSVKKFSFRFVVGLGYCEEVLTQTSLYSLLKIEEALEIPGNDNQLKGEFTLATDHANEYYGEAWIPNEQFSYNGCNHLATKISFYFKEDNYLLKVNVKCDGPGFEIYNSKAVCVRH